VALQCNTENIRTIPDFVEWGIRTLLQTTQASTKMSAAYLKQRKKNRAISQQTTRTE